MTHRPMLATAAASAALLCAAAPAMADPSVPWSGFYVGGNIGGVAGEGSATVSASPGSGGPTVNPLDVTAINSATASGSKSGGGFTGGVQGGYNWVGQGWLFGIETDWEALDISNGAAKTVQSAATPGLTYTLSQSVKTDWMWTLRPRLGFFTGNWLFYGTVGLAVSEVKSTLHFNDNAAAPHTLSQDTSDTESGWIGGLGVAYAWAPEWSVRGEWLYTDFGTVSGSGTTSGGFATIKSDASVRGNIFRVGVDYRF